MGECAELRDRRGSLVKRYEMCSIEGPARVLDTRPTLEVESIQGHGVPVMLSGAPERRAAAKASHCGMFEAEIRMADALASEGLLRLASAALENANSGAGVQELESGDDSSRARADDAHVCVELLVGGE